MLDSLYTVKLKKDEIVKITNKTVEDKEVTYSFDGTDFSVVYYFMSDNVVLKNLPNLKEYLEYLLSLMESFYFYPAS